MPAPSNAEAVNTIMVTTRCSAKCGHCPFSSPDLPELFLSREKIIEMLTKSDAALSVISGGEPFEHPDISGILQELTTVSSPFRIATGGFVDFAPYREKLVLLAKSKGGFQGISLGTDVLTQRCPDTHLAAAWRRNLAYLESDDIPYSLTITTGEPVDSALIEDLPVHGSLKPQFIYLRSASPGDQDRFSSALRNKWHDVPVLAERIL